jgi:hypothetical protein
MPAILVPSAATLATSVGWADEVARSRRLTEACEVVRAAGRGEPVELTALAAAEAVVAAGCEPPSWDERQHRRAMAQLVEEAVRAHSGVLGYHRWPLG